MLTASSAQRRNNRTALLLVEDDDVDRDIMLRQLGQRFNGQAIEVASDGEEALAKLRRKSDEAGARPSYIVLLDLAMPGMGGTEFLAALRADPDLATTIVFVVSGSLSEADIERTLACGAAGFIPKGNLETGYGRVVEMIQRYTKAVCLPSCR